VTTPALSCVILTRGDRPAELERAICSIRAQHGEQMEVVLVLNGVLEEPEVPSGVVVERLDVNMGVPGGRNAGIRRASGDVIVFLDDDGWLPDPGSADRLRSAFRRDQRLAIVSFRIVDPDTGRTERRHVPRLRAGDPERSSFVTTYLGGACAIRRSVIDSCGDFAASFFFGHEESDFAWRALDRGHHIRYDAGLVMYHPNRRAAGRHASYHYLNARNRVWLARRRLPGVLAVLYVLTWTTLQAARERSMQAYRQWAAGVLAGVQEPPGPRQRMRWRTVLAMTALGRPPVI
jgi:GT2 family glycosyltransferase